MACRRREACLYESYSLPASQLLVLLGRSLKEEGTAKKLRGQRWRV